MKKIIILILLTFITASAMATVSFEIGARVGQIGFDEDEDILDSGSFYGIEGILNINDSMRVRCTLDFYDNETSDSYNYNYSDTWTEEDYWYIYTYSVNLTQTYNFEEEISYIPLFFSFEYLWNFEKLSIYAGGGLGYSFNDYDISMTSIITNNYTGYAYDSGYSASGSADNSFLYGITTGFEYNLNDRFSLAFDFAYIFGEVDYDSSASDGYNFIDYSDSIDLDHYSANLAGKIKI